MIIQQRFTQVLSALRAAEEKMSRRRIGREIGISPEALGYWYEKGANPTLLNICAAEAWLIKNKLITPSTEISRVADEVESKDFDLEKLR